MCCALLIDSFVDSWNFIMGCFSALEILVAKSFIVYYELRTRCTKRFTDNGILDEMEKHFNEYFQGHTYRPFKNFLQQSKDLLTVKLYNIIGLPTFKCLIFANKRFCEGLFLQICLFLT